VSFGGAEGFAMRRSLLLVLGLCLGVLTPSAGRAQGGKKGPPPAAKPAKPEAYYAANETLKDKVRLSDEMAAKLTEIVSRKPTPYQRTLRVAPRGYIVVGGKSYAYFGFLASDPEKGDSWDDPVLGKLWDELNRVEYKAGLGPLKDFKP
jgi:hypothetical protein